MFSKLLSILQLLLSIIEKITSAIRDNKLKQSAIKEAELEELRLKSERQATSNEVDDLPTPADKSDILDGM